MFSLILREKYSRIYVCTYSKECTFPNLAPKGRNDTANRHISPQLLVENVQCQYINSTEIHGWQSTCTARCSV